MANGGFVEKGPRVGMDARPVAARGLFWLSVLLIGCLDSSLGGAHGAQDPDLEGLKARCAGGVCHFFGIPLIYRRHLGEKVEVLADVRSFLLC